MTEQEINQEIKSLEKRIKELKQMKKELKPYTLVSEWTRLSSRYNNETFQHHKVSQHKTLELAKKHIMQQLATLKRLAKKNVEIVMVKFTINDNPYRVLSKI